MHFTWVFKGTEWQDAAGVQRLLLLRGHRRQAGQLPEDLRAGWCREGGARWARRAAAAQGGGGSSEAAATAACSTVPRRSGVQWAPQGVPKVVGQAGGQQPHTAGDAAGPPTPITACNLPPAAGRLAGH